MRVRKVKNMILLQTNTKRRESGEKCHTITMMHRKPVKTFKMRVHHVPLRKMNHTRRYEQCHRENRCKNTPKQGSNQPSTTGDGRKRDPHFSQKFLYQERHVWYKPTLYRPGTQRNGKSGMEKTPGQHVSCNPMYRGLL